MFALLDRDTYTNTDQDPCAYWPFNIGKNSSYSVKIFSDFCHIRILLVGKYLNWASKIFSGIH